MFDRHKTLLFLLKLNIKLKELYLCLLYMRLCCQCYAMIFKVHTTLPCWRNVVQIFVQDEGVLLFETEIVDIIDFDVPLISNDFDSWEVLDWRDVN